MRGDLEKLIQTCDCRPTTNNLCTAYVGGEEGDGGGEATRITGKVVNSAGCAWYACAFLWPQFWSGGLRY